MYTTSSQSQYIITQGLYLLHDTPHERTTKKILEKYLIDAHAVFLEKINILVNFKEKLEQKDEEHLSTMLHLMIDARKAWEDESH